MLVRQAYRSKFGRVLLRDRASKRNRKVSELRPLVRARQDSDSFRVEVPHLFVMAFDFPWRFLD